MWSPCAIEFGSPFHGCRSLQIFMKTSSLLLLSLVTLPWPAASQSPVGNEKATVVERGPRHARWSWTGENIWPDGQVTTEEHSVIETATGLNYLQDGKEGQWVPSTDVVEVFQDYAVARHGQHQVIWAANFNSAGAVDLLLPDGKRLVSHVVGIAYTDAATGQSVLIAEPKDTIGEVGGNQVIYRDALKGPFHADIRYTYTIGGLEQDVILHQPPPSPADYGLDPATSRLEVWSEFLAPPAPT